MDGGSSSTVTLGQNSGITVAGDSADVTVAGVTVVLGSNAKIDLGTGTTSVFTLKADTLSAADARTDGDSTAKANIIGSGTLNLSTYSVDCKMYVESADSSSSKDGLHVLQGDISGTGEVTIRTLNKGRNIDSGDTSTSTTNLELPAGYFEDGNTTARVFHDGYLAINFGQSDGTGTLTKSGTTNFTDKVNILQGETDGNGIVVKGTINTGANDFNVKSNKVTIQKATVTTTTGNVNITTDTLVNDISSGKNTIGSTAGGSLTITTYTKDKSINLGSTTGDGLNIDNTWFDTSNTTIGLFQGFKNVTFGDSNQTGGVKIGTIDTMKVTDVTNIVRKGVVTDGGTGGITTNKVVTKFVINPRTVVVQANSDTKIYAGKSYTGGKGYTYGTGVNGQGFIANDRDTNGAPKSGVVTDGTVNYGQVSTAF